MEGEWERREGEKNKGEKQKVLWTSQLYCSFPLRVRSTLLYDSKKQQHLNHHNLVTGRRTSRRCIILVWKIWQQPSISAELQVGLCFRCCRQPIWTRIKRDASYQIIVFIMVRQMKLSLKQVVDGFIRGILRNVSAAFVFYLPSWYKHRTKGHKTNSLHRSRPNLYPCA